MEMTELCMRFHHVPLLRCKQFATCLAKLHSPTKHPPFLIKYYLKKLFYMIFLLQYIHQQAGLVNNTYNNINAVVSTWQHSYLGQGPKVCANKCLHQTKGSFLFCTNCLTKCVTNTKQMQLPRNHLRCVEQTHTNQQRKAVCFKFICL